MPQNSIKINNQINIKLLLLITFSYDCLESTEIA